MSSIFITGKWFESHVNSTKTLFCPKLVMCVTSFIFDALSTTFAHCAKNTPDFFFGDVVPFLLQQACQILQVMVWPEMLTNSDT